VHEGIIAAGFIRDEAVTLGLVEKLHCSGSHIYFLQVRRSKADPLALREAREGSRSRKAPKTVNLRL
jgi:hypothetical protein